MKGGTINPWILCFHLFRVDALPGGVYRFFAGGGLQSFKNICLKIHKKPYNFTNSRRWGVSPNSSLCYSPMGLVSIATPHSVYALNDFCLLILSSVSVQWCKYWQCAGAASKINLIKVIILKEALPPPPSLRGDCTCYSKYIPVSRRGGGKGWRNCTVTTTRPVPRLPSQPCVHGHDVSVFIRQSQREHVHSWAPVIQLKTRFLIWRENEKSS